MHILLTLLFMTADKPVHCSRPVGWVFGEECVSKALKALRDSHGGKFVLTDDEYETLKTQCYLKYREIPWTCQ